MVKNISILLLLILISACAKPVGVDRDLSYYKSKGDEYFKSGKYKRAIEAYENALIRAENPEDAAEVQLALADTYYSYKEYNEAIPIYEAYLEVYSNDVTADVAYLRLGLSHYELVNRTARDQTDTAAALKYFNLIKDRNEKLYNEYGLSEKVKFLRNRLAAKELFVAKYYSRIRKWNPSILRYQYLIENYEDTTYYEEAIYRVAKLLKKVERYDDMETYITILKVNRPSSPYVKKALKLLND